MASDERICRHVSIGMCDPCRNQWLLADNARLTAENAALRAAGEALAAKSPCFLTIRPTGDIECCQFCLEDNGHAAGCEWVAFVAALAGPVSGGGGEGA